MRTTATLHRIARTATLASVVAATLGLASISAAAQAQGQQIGVDPFGFAICAGPLGPGRCADIAAWLQRGGNNGSFGGAIPAPPTGNFGMGPIGPAGLPTSIVPHDGQLVAEITQSCGGNPKCIAAAWASVEVQRCANGIGVPGGCFGPNGEIAKAARVILNDITHGPGPRHDIFGEDGWLCETLLGGC